ncbi:MAG: hypothetical protein DWP97_04380 [Calditrichaeota bacterium]|nr:MAG: hypothetical protein DWP97_04380 [Calditrichota bacterium]
MKKIILLSLLIIIAGTAHADNPEILLNQFMNKITGSYSSYEQAAADSYYIDLHLNVKEIWKTEDSSRWLLLQTSFSSDTLYPYKNQLFHLYPYALNLIRIDIYSISEKKAFFKTVDSSLAFDTTFLEYVSISANCELYLNHIKSTFAAYSKSDKCPNNLRGASYANTDIELDGDELYIWERGYNSKDEQVWGPLNGGYIFKKLFKRKK